MRDPLKNIKVPTYGVPEIFLMITDIGEVFGYSFAYELIRDGYIPDWVIFCEGGFVKKRMILFDECQMGWKREAKAFGIAQYRTPDYLLALLLEQSDEPHSQEFEGMRDFLIRTDSFVLKDDPDVIDAMGKVLNDIFVQADIEEARKTRPGLPKGEWREISPRASGSAKDLKPAYSVDINIPLKIADLKPGSEHKVKIDPGMKIDHVNIILE